MWNSLSPMPERKEVEAVKGRINLMLLKYK